MSWLIGVAAIVLVLLGWAGWMDVQAARQGKKWVPVQEGRRRRRTRFHLVDKADWEESRRLILLDESIAKRDAVRRGPAGGGYLFGRKTTPGPGRRSKRT